MGAYFGGTRQPMAVAWPGHIKPGSNAAVAVSPRDRYRANDLRNVLKITPPRVVNGFEQDPIAGVSMVYAFNDAKAQGTPNDPVLRHYGKPRHLPRRLVCQCTGAA